ncbi:MAG TPA: hypothetical protein VGO90_14450 [Chthoniobacteraceae bacterium]|nr:hypothetical protein [Chthoniobacteraceae bacterium]
MLHRGGYSASAALGVGAAVFWWKKRNPSLRLKWRLLAGWRRRFRRPAPLVFLVALILAFVGGALYEPNNYDALTYRFPQILHWLDRGAWHWIDTWNVRLNLSGTAFSWMMVPAFLATNGSRLFFLPNVVSFALLPGLLFALLRGLGVSGRTAWWWMWLLPSGYGYILQAGSVATDLFGTVYVLAAIVFALRARRRSSVSDVWLSLLAAALATGTKVVLLPLMLPCLVAIAPALRLLRSKVPVSAAVLATAVLVSIAPTLLLNIRHTGHWSGDPTDPVGVQVKNPFYGIAANGIQTVVQNLAPPVFPIASKWNAFVAQLDQTPAIQHLRKNFQQFGLRLGEISQEETAPLGLALTLLIAVSAIGALRSSGSGSKGAGRLAFQISVASAIAFAALLAKTGSEMTPRLALAYYPLLVLPILLPRASVALTRQRWWRVLAILCAASALIPLILTPARPLWPALSVLRSLERRFPESNVLRRGLDVYQIYAARWDNLAAMRGYLPPDAKVVGFLSTVDDSQTSLWRPFGSRRVQEVIEAAPEARTVHVLRGSVLIASARGIRDQFGQEPDAFSRAIRGQVIGRERVSIKASVGPEDWYAIALPRDPAGVRGSRAAE